MEIRLETPLTYDKIKDLKAGDSVLLSGVIYSARDAAHKRLIELLEAGKELPIEIKDQTIYYVGPSPEKPGQVIGSAGPTTSYRMDDYTPQLLNLGLKGMIGKGKRNDEVVKSIVENKAVYFGAIGGAGALISKCIKYLPLIVIIDSEGNNLYKIGREEYLKLKR